MFNIFVFVFTLIAFPVHAGLINGSFERGISTGPQGYVAVQDFSSIPGWIAFPTIELIDDDFWDAPDGERSVDLSAKKAGAISQHVETMPGTLYRVGFDMAGNPYGTQGMKPLRVSANSDFQDYFFDTRGQTVDDMGWMREYFEFLADEESVLLSFRSLTNSAAGPAIDNVSFSVVPLPASLGLLGMALIVGLGFVMRRK